MKEVLDAKMVRLETKVTNMESKIQQQNSLLIALQNERHGDDVEMKLHGSLTRPINYKKLLISMQHFAFILTETKAMVDDLAIKLNGKLY